MEKVHILLPVHNRKDVTRRFIECLRGQTYQNYHLVLIDDGSTDGTEAMVREHISDLTLIRGTGDWWWAGALQQGYLWLKEQKAGLDDIVLIINDDTEFDSHFLERGIKLMKDRQHALLLAQCFSRQSGELLDAGVHADWRRLRFEQAAKPEEINCLSTRGLFIRAGDFFDTGGFRPQLLPHYGSDYEFTIRAHRKGMKLITDPLLRLWVDEKATGYHSLEAPSVAASLRKLVSLKSSKNPFIWMVFIGLACPWRWKLLNWIKIWGIIFHSLFQSRRRASPVA